jgi:hypothetical protein
MARTTTLRAGSGSPTGSCSSSGTRLLPGPDHGHLEQYYVLTPNQIIVFDLKTRGLDHAPVRNRRRPDRRRAPGTGWLGPLDRDHHRRLQFLRPARRFVGSAQYPLWALTVLALTLVVLDALIVRSREAIAQPY